MRPLVPFDVHTRALPAAALSGAPPGGARGGCQQAQNPSSQLSEAIIESLESNGQSSVGVSRAPARDPKDAGSDTNTQGESLGGGAWALGCPSGSEGTWRSGLAILRRPVFYGLQIAPWRVGLASTEAASPTQSSGAGCRRRP